ncbi:MAG TPA: T9SS type A sorting domain-containing protein [Flavipsychrobacter sp.]|jgi:hypothetical protein|nr:T9SS type A sorting domain-containing protein [Flavipsychrobacter sp.]
MKNHLIALCFLYGVVAKAQPPIKWQYCYGDTTADYAICMEPISEGYIIAGYKSQCLKGMEDFWVYKINHTGSLLWEKCLGGSQMDRAWAIQSAADGGYIVVGTTMSSDGDLINNKGGGGDFWVVKLGSLGNLQWQKTYGGSGLDIAYGVKQSRSGAYYVCGETSSTNGDVTNNKGSRDMWLIKLSSNGTLLWQKTYGGSGEEAAFAMDTTYDGGVVLAGQATTADGSGDVSQILGLRDYWVVKVDSSGTLQWERVYGTAGEEWVQSIRQTKDAGFVISGNIASNQFAIQQNMCVLKISSSGVLQWQTNPGTTSVVDGRDIRQTKDLGYVLVGGGIDATAPGSSAKNYLIVKYSPTGTIQWKKFLGGTLTSFARAVVETNDTGYVIAGITLANDGDISGNHGKQDAWVVKVGYSTTGIDPIGSSTLVEVFPNPTSGIVNFSEMVDVRVYNYLGQLVLKSSKVKQVSLEEFPKGIYLFELTHKYSAQPYKVKILKQ